MKVDQIMEEAQRLTNIFNRKYRELADLLERKIEEDLGPVKSREDVISWLNQKRTSENSDWWEIDHDHHKDNFKTQVLNDFKLIESMYPGNENALGYYILNHVARLQNMHEDKLCKIKKEKGAVAAIRNYYPDENFLLKFSSEDCAEWLAEATRFHEKFNEILNKKDDAQDQESTSNPSDSSDDKFETLKGILDNCGLLDSTQHINHHGPGPFNGIYKAIREEWEKSIVERDVAGVSVKDEKLNLLYFPQINQFQKFLEDKFGYSASRLTLGKSSQKISQEYYSIAKRSL